MKFGGTSVADADRMRAVAEIVRGHLDRRPVVVVSAIAGVTDRLVQSARAAADGDRDGLEPLLADIERRNRWALAAVEAPGARHDLGLAVDELFEQLRGRLRSIRILGEGTQKSTDAVLALGDTLGARIATAAMVDAGVPARWVDAGTVMVAAPPFGSGVPDLAATRERAAAVRAIADEGHVPVMAGFVGATPTGETITLGRGGSDTSAAVLGLALDADAIQIWTDVDGVMSADPRQVPQAQTLPTVRFEEAAQLAFHGARVLHPASIAPAVRRRIPVHVRNTMRPSGEGTLVEPDDAGSDVDSEVGSTVGRPSLAIAHRAPVSIVACADRTLRGDPGLHGRLVDALAAQRLTPVLTLGVECGVTAVVAGLPDADALQAALGETIDVEVVGERALVSVVGRGLADPDERCRVLREIAAGGPERVVSGGTGTTASALVPAADLTRFLGALHRVLCEGES